MLHVITHRDQPIHIKVANLSVGIATSEVVSERWSNADTPCRRFIGIPKSRCTALRTSPHPVPISSSRALEFVAKCARTKSHRSTTSPSSTSISSAPAPPLFTQEAKMPPLSCALWTVDIGRYESPSTSKANFPRTARSTSGGSVDMVVVARA